MMKNEFEILIGHSVDHNCFDRIERVYMECQLFETKQDLARFYKKYDMNGIERIFRQMFLMRDLMGKADFANGCLAADAYRELLSHYQGTF